VRRREVFWQDGYHLRHEGGVLYAELLARTIAERAPKVLAPG
jgi:hypothetical protein